jgi:hypothetical protein
MALLLVKIAHAQGELRTSTTEGPGFDFCNSDKPRVRVYGGAGDTELEAAIEFLEDVYQ